jgi:AAA15 family ATPase/GTPase
MRIEELIIEGTSPFQTPIFINPSHSLLGFKSYPVRTQITGWDPTFNAITGLNGSGKSNILDAICFVLGLTDMNQVFINLFSPHAFQT